jgi:hypothetical protein
MCLRRVRCARRLAELGDVGEPQGGLAAPDLFGSKADIAVRLRNVRFTPESGRWVTAFGCPLSAWPGIETELIVSSLVLMRK